MPSIRQAIDKGTSRTTATQDSPLASYLHSHGVQEIVIVGIATDVCVKATAEDALACGFEIILVEEAMKGVEDEASERMAREFGHMDSVKVFSRVREVHSLLC
jgi:nicotinamidase-related amidase